MEQVAKLKAKSKLIDFHLENAKKVWQIYCHHPNDLMDELSLVVDGISQQCHAMVEVANELHEGYPLPKKRRVSLDD